MTTRTEALGQIEDGLRGIARRLKRAFAERIIEVHPDLQPASFLILTWLADHGPARGSSLACRFGIDKGAISRQVQHLVDLGLVTRTADPEDGRAVLVSATPDAIELLEREHMARRTAWEGQLSAWTVEELSAFAQQLTRFDRDLG